MTQGVRWLYGDTETTGFDPLTGDRIVEIAMVECVDDRLTGNTYHQYINPCRLMPEEAYRVHGLNDEFLADKPVFADVVDEFLAFVNGAELIFHNAEFDMKFINHHVSEARRKPTWRSHTCTLVLAKEMYPKSRHSLDALITRFNIDGSARKKHGAMIDSRLLAEVHAHLTGKRSLDLVQVSDQGGADVADAEAFPDWRYAQPAPKAHLIAIGDGDIEAHRAFLTDRKIGTQRWEPLHDWFPDLMAEAAEADHEDQAAA